MKKLFKDPLFWFMFSLSIIWTYWAMSLMSTEKSDNNNMTISIKFENSLTEINK